MGSCSENKRFRNDLKKGRAVFSYGAPFLLPLSVRKDVLRTGVRHFLDDPAGDFRAGIARGLGGEVVGAVVDNDRFADDLLHSEAAGQKQGQGSSPAFQQGRQVSGVVGMLAAIGIIMGHGVGEGVAHVAGAAAAGVDVEAEEAPLAGGVEMGQTAELGADEDASIGLVEPHHARYVRVAFAARDACRRLGGAVEDGEEVHRGIVEGRKGRGRLHKKRSLSFRFTWHPMRRRVKWRKIWGVFTQMVTQPRAVEPIGPKNRKKKRNVPYCEIQHAPFFGGGGGSPALPALSGRKAADGQSQLNQTQVLLFMDREDVLSRSL